MCWRTGNLQGEVLVGPHYVVAELEESGRKKMRIGHLYLGREMCVLGSLFSSFPSHVGGETPRVCNDC